MTLSGPACREHNMFRSILPKMVTPITCPGTFAHRRGANANRSPRIHASQETPHERNMNTSSWTEASATGTNCPSTLCFIQSFNHIPLLRHIQFQAITKQDPDCCTGGGTTNSPRHWSHSDGRAFSAVTLYSRCN